MIRLLWRMIVSSVSLFSLFFKTFDVHTNFAYVHMRCTSLLPLLSVALLVLERDSVHPWIKINADGNVPTSGDELAVMVSLGISYSNDIGRNLASSICLQP